MNKDIAIFPIGVVAVSERESRALTRARTNGRCDIEREMAAGHFREQWMTLGGLRGLSNNTDHSHEIV